MNNPPNVQISSAQTNKPLHKSLRIASIFIVFWYALLGWLRFVISLRYQSYFIELDIWPRPLYIILSGLGIGIGFSIAMVFMIIKANFTPVYFRILGFIFLAWFWFDQIWIGTWTSFRNQAVLPIVITLITIMLMFIFVKTRDYQKGRNA